MKFRMPIFLALMLGLLPAAASAQAPYSNQPSYDPNIPIQFGAGQTQGRIVALPPQLPEYLPNGAINLDEVWIQDGGARLYWNDVIIPRQLKMAGASWIDPALVPQLIPQKQAPARRVWRKAKTRVATVKKVKVPAKVSSTALKSPAIPLPVTPAGTTEATEIKPLKAPSAPAAAQAAPLAPPRAESEMPDVTPPRLQ